MIMPLNVLNCLSIGTKQISMHHWEYYIYNKFNFICDIEEEIACPFANQKCHEFHSIFLIFYSGPPGHRAKNSKM